MSVNSRFMPRYNHNAVLSPAAASASATIDVQKLNKQVRFVNSGANICYVQTYSSLESTAPTATTADFPIAAGSTVIITKPQEHDMLCHISASGTTLNVMCGEGF